MMKQKLICLIMTIIVSACLVTPARQEMSEDEKPREHILLNVNVSEIDGTKFFTLDSATQQQLASGINLEANPGLKSLDELLHLGYKEVSSRENSDFELSNQNTREARKMNLFQGMWRKPKISPLYLINGTVCRFIDSKPICTTLSTNGLLPSGVSNSSASTQRSATTPARAGLFEDDYPGINLQNFAASSLGSPAKPSLFAPNMIQGFKPASSVNRNPLNLLLFKRPTRQLRLA